MYSANQFLKVQFCVTDWVQAYSQLGKYLLFQMSTIVSHNMQLLNSSFRQDKPVLYDQCFLVFWVLAGWIGWPATECLNTQHTGHENKELLNWKLAEHCPTRMVMRKY